MCAVPLNQSLERFDTGSTLFLSAKIKHFCFLSWLSFFINEGRADGRRYVAENFICR